MCLGIKDNYKAFAITRGNVYKVGSIKKKKKVGSINFLSLTLCFMSVKF